MNSTGGKKIGPILARKRRIREMQRCEEIRKLHGAHEALGAFAVDVP